jgi:hypothetical protein
MWLHGTVRDEVAHGVILSDSHHVAVVDSYLNDFKCVAKSGACTDAQTISGGNDSTAGVAKAYKIVNNFLESSGENIMFGGGASADTAGDIEIRRNHLYKPMSWNPGSSTFAGVHWIVKNHLELKNATRVLIEGNVWCAHPADTQEPGRRMEEPLSHLLRNPGHDSLQPVLYRSPGVSNRERKKPEWRICKSRWILFNPRQRRG